MFSQLILRSSSAPGLILHAQLTKHIVLTATANEIRREGLTGKQQLRLLGQTSTCATATNLLSPFNYTSLSS
jgi:hypothetical protein